MLELALLAMIVFIMVLSIFILKRAGSLLCDEWGYALSVPVAQAEVELQRLLLRPVAVESTAV